MQPQSSSAEGIFIYFLNIHCKQCHIRMQHIHPIKKCQRHTSPRQRQLLEHKKGCPRRRNSPFENFIYCVICLLEWREPAETATWETAWETTALVVAILSNAIDCIYNLKHCITTQCTIFRVDNACLTNTT